MANRNAGELESKLFDGKPVIKFDKEVDRRNFLKYAGIVGVGGTLVMAGCKSTTTPGEDDPTDASPSKMAENVDTPILNYALTLEYLESEFYTKGVSGSVLSGREKALIEPIAAHEKAHVDALIATVKKVGGKPVAKPTFVFPEGTFTDKAKFLETAVTFEELGVSAYHGQVTKIETKELLAAAASIAGVESRHAAILQDLTGGDPFPSPVETTKTMDEVLAAATPFIKS
ncbi:MAG: ferritin-like domain-containing protein [Actinomycetota bacterium]